MMIMWLLRLLIVNADIIGTGHWSPGNHLMDPTPHNWKGNHLMDPTPHNWKGNQLMDPTPHNWKGNHQTQTRDKEFNIGKTKTCFLKLSLHTMCLSLNWKGKEIIPRGEQDFRFWDCDLDGICLILKTWEQSIKCSIWDKSLVHSLKIETLLKC
jgi:hypothetical protein